jgi:hypothetical protein
LFAQPHPARQPIGLYSRCIAWNDKFGSSFTYDAKSSSYHLVAVPAASGKKGAGVRIFVKGMIEGAAAAEEKKMLTGYKVDVGGMVDKMVFTFAADGSGAGAGGGGGGGGTAVESDSGVTSPTEKSSQNSSNKSFSFGSLLSKAKMFSISMDSKGSSAAAAVVSDADVKPSVPYEPVAGWASWLTLGNRFAFGR